MWKHVSQEFIICSNWTNKQLNTTLLIHSTHTQKTTFFPLFWFMSILCQMKHRFSDLLPQEKKFDIWKSMSFIIMIILWLNWTSKDYHNDHFIIKSLFWMSFRCCTDFLEMFHSYRPYTYIQTQKQTLIKNKSIRKHNCFAFITYRWMLTHAQMISLLL